VVSGREEMWASKSAGVRSSVTVDIVLVKDEGVMRDGGHLGTREWRGILKLRRQGACRA
jgi:hypothetical protein